ncbi:MAG: hypothetical protein V7K21_27855 [Nostoc sp.]|uniref:hypothetical protein n=1 Tax=Nostoc sp. TaxID=1180 RepID=UPI002FF5B8AF
MKFLFKNLKAIATVNMNQDGRFSYTMGNLKAAHHQRGTSESAMNAIDRTHPIKIRS